jgi:hypothetical protein
MLPLLLDEKKISRPSDDQLTPIRYAWFCVSCLASPSLTDARNRSICSP